MSKQDRTHSRTPADTENKFLHNLGKRFAEIMGVATDARRTAEGTRSELSKSVAEINKELTDKGASIKLIVDSGIVDKDGNVQASIVISAINKQSEAKIKADNIVFEGQKLNIKVDATDIEGKVTANQIDATELEVDAAKVTGKLTADQIDATNLKVKAANIEDKLTAEQINADDMNIKKATIGGWHLAKTQVPISQTSSTEEFALYSDKIFEENGDRDYTYQVYLTAKGVCVDGVFDTSNEKGVPYFSRKTWLEICEL